MVRSVNMKSIDDPVRRCERLIMINLRTDRGRLREMITYYISHFHVIKNMIMDRRICRSMIRING